MVFDYQKSLPDVTIVIPLYNYELFVLQALNSAAEQSENVGLVVVDDASTDGSLNLVYSWMTNNCNAFSTCQLYSNDFNSGLSITRNIGIHECQSEFVFFLDADNIIYPRCIERLRDSLKSQDAAFAYPILQVFGDNTGLMGTESFSREKLKKGNYIDAMAMVRRSVLLSHGGYHDLTYGWEDYDLWLRICENGERGIHVPEILARYRVHKNSMLRTVTSTEHNHAKLRREMLKRHSWLEI